MEAGSCDGENGVGDAVHEPLNALTKGVEEGWIRPPARSGPIGQADPMASKRNTDELIAEDRSDRL